MDPARFRRLCAGLHRLSPRQVSELGIRLAGVGARSEALAALDRRAAAMRGRGARALGRRSARAAAAAKPRLRTHLHGLGGLGSGRTAPDRGVPRRASRHGVRRAPGVVPAAGRTARDRQGYGLAMAHAHSRRAGAGDGGRGRGRPEDPAGVPQGLARGGPPRARSAGLARSRRARPGASGAGRACPCRSAPAAGGYPCWRWSSAPGTDARGG